MNALEWTSSPGVSVVEIRRREDAWKFFAAPVDNDVVHDLHNDLVIINSINDFSD